jgi:hypothetical protein
MPTSTKKRYPAIIEKFDSAMVKSLSEQFDLKDQDRLSRHLNAADASYGVVPAALSADQVKKLDQFGAKIAEALEIWRSLDGVAKDYLWDRSPSLGTGKYIQGAKPLIDEALWPPKLEGTFSDLQFNELTNELRFLEELAKTDTQEIANLRARKGKPANEKLRATIRALWVVWVEEFKDRSAMKKAKDLQFRHFVQIVMKEIDPLQVELVTNSLKVMRASGELPKLH